MEWEGNPLLNGEEYKSYAFIRIEFCLLVRNNRKKGAVLQLKSGRLFFHSSKNGTNFFSLPLLLLAFAPFFPYGTMINRLHIWCCCRSECCHNKRILITDYCFAYASTLSSLPSPPSPPPEFVSFALWMQFFLYQFSHIFTLCSTHKVCVVCFFHTTLNSFSLPSRWKLLWFFYFTLPFISLWSVQKKVGVAKCVKVCRKNRICFRKKRNEKK